MGTIEFVPPPHKGFAVDAFKESMEAINKIRDEEDAEVQALLSGKQE